MSLSQFYRSREWEGFRRVVIHERTNDCGEVICEYCNKPIVKAYDCIAHHKQALTEQNYIYADIALNPENIMLVHHVCHNRIHNKLGYSGREVYIVHGAPLSGKTNYVSNCMEEGDLVIDIDNIWQCVSGCERYVKPNRLKSVVFGARDNLLEAVKYRRGKWLNAYIIQSLPVRNDRERMADELGAKLVHIDTDKETCLQRLYESGDGRDVSQWKEYIENYFREFELYN